MVGGVEVYKVKIVGIKPLLMNKPNLTTTEGKKRRRSEIPDPESEAKSRLYLDKKGNIVIPSLNVKACIRSAGRNYKVPQRKATYASMIRAGLDIEPSPYIPLIHDSWEIDIRPVVVQGNRILRARPRFDKWALEFRIINRDPTILHRDMVKQILEDAGKYYGLGDYRPEFGLFKVEMFKIVEDFRYH